MTITTATERILPLARAIQEYWEAELPKRHPKYPLVDPNADDGPPPPETEQLRQLLEQLPENTLYKLEFILSPGRARFDKSRLESRYQELRDEYDAPFLIVHMLDNVHLADELEYGMETLNERGIGLDQLDLIPAGV